MVKKNPTVSEATLAQEHREHDIELIIGGLLRICVIITVIIVLIGVVLFLPSHISEVPNYHTFASEPDALRSVWGIVGLAFSGNGAGIIQLGLLFLVLTPILRVVFSVFAFLHEKDFLYVAITLLVLGLLIFSLAGG